ncbi:MAG: winged helix-turn-helix transcriptional regulator [Candidatus Nealsonbacteria bacterium]|nr:winged helix-turn-helix transcriptional regulator [Candidatus Nealsonbacteria bacterium]
MNKKENILRKSGFYEVILSLGKQKTFTEIMDETGLTTATISRRLKEMKNHGFIRKNLDPVDEKVKYFLTTKGTKNIGLIDVIVILEKALEEKGETKEINERIEKICSECHKKIFCVVENINTGNSSLECISCKKQYPLTVSGLG